MTEQGGALAKLRQAIERRVDMAFEQSTGEERGGLTQDDHRAIDEAVANLDAELATAESRIELLATFVRAFDAMEAALAAVKGYSYEETEAYDVAEARMRAARAAISDEDLA